MIEERSFHPLDYMSVVRRRMWWFIAPLAFFIVVANLVVDIVYALLDPRVRYL